jgi:hypothetical protein
VARHPHTTSLARHATTSLARLWPQQGTRTVADVLLAPVAGGCTAGGDTADFQ